MIEARDFDLRWENRRCTVNPLGAKKSQQVARRLANLLGTALKGGGEADVMGAIGALLTSIDDESLAWLTRTFSDVTLIEKEAGADEWVRPLEIEDLVFGGSEGLLRWTRWLTFCLETSCGAFFTELRQAWALARKKMAEVAEANRSLSTSMTSGSSTASPPAAATPTA